ncbi:N-acetylmuramoyl-L-alanine amidase [Actinomyces trachealis]|uniref:N-acetylmuramoyl-L-alanine amidase n=1 Tax=Actinomyces trachealis TaxID=2763540 RepID=UPI0018C5CF3B|nr:N-acetylmuramoyl-L-alanine amidase [Actinomyces trachealis]
MNLKTAVISFATLSLVCAAGLAQPSTGAQAWAAVRPNSDKPAPVQLLTLIDSSGTTTEIAKAGLGTAQKEAVQESEAQAPASSSGGTAVSPRLGPRLHLALAGPANGAPVDPEADATLLTKPMMVEDFMVAGFAWNDGMQLPEGAQVFLRVRERGTWSKWFRNEVDASTGPDGSSARGTEEIVTAGSDAVQVSVVLRSAAELQNLPKGLHLVLVPARPEGEKAKQSADLPTVAASKTAVEEEEPLETVSDKAKTSAEEDQPTASSDGSTAGAASASVASGGLLAGASGGAAVGLSTSTLLRAVVGASGLPVDINTRADWGADEGLMEWDTVYAPAKHVVVHHTAGSNNYTADQSASIVRGIYYYHSQTLGWGDIGYNILVDKYGQVFEGRHGTLAAAPGKMAVGGHARGVNTGSIGISMMGDYSSVEPTSIQLEKVGQVAGWFLNRAGISDANATAPLAIRATERYWAGQSVDLPVIIGHRDVGYTACPGERGYSKLGQIRQIAQASMSSGGTGASRNSSNPGTAGSGLAAGWNRRGSTWYYVGSDGRTKLTGWQLIGSSWFHFSALGEMSTGWLAEGGNWYYLDRTNGNLRTGWVKDGNGWFYLEPRTGAMSTGWFKDGGSWYYLRPGSGQMATGWLKDDGAWYYLSPASGAMNTGWFKDGGAWYYLSPERGAMSMGWFKDGGSWYYLRPGSGQMATGWLKDGRSWYYLSPASGAMSTGWLKHAGSWYWLTPGRGNMATGVVLAEGQWSQFSSTGAWLGYTSAPAGNQGGNAAASNSGTVLQAHGNGLHKVMAAPSASKQVLVGKMTAAYAARGGSYPTYALGPAGASSPAEFFTIVYEEAVAEGVSPELLFAQVVKETGWLRFGGDVRIQQNNFGGIGAVGGGASGNSFPDVRTGLRAQAQHLRAYGDPGATVAGLAHPVVDPRFTYVRKGGARYVEHLGIQENPARTGWAAARGYGRDLVSLIQQYFG